MYRVPDHSTAHPGGYLTPAALFLACRPRIQAQRISNRLSKSPPSIRTGHISATTGEPRYVSETESGSTYPSTKAT